MNSLHNRQRVGVQMEQPVLDREGGFPVKSRTGSITKKQLNNASEDIQG